MSDAAAQPSGRARCPKRAALPLRRKDELRESQTPNSQPTTLNSQLTRVLQKSSQFDWPVCHAAEEILLHHLDAFLARNSFARELAGRMRDETGTQLLDWVDHLVLPASDESALRDAGFVEDPLGETADNRPALHHPEALLPRVVLAQNDARFPEALAIRVESLLDFMVAHGVSAEPEGEPWTRLRSVVAAVENGTRLLAVERRGYRGFVPAQPQPGEMEALLKARELWQTRPRACEDAREGWRQARARLGRVLERVGRDLACHVVFEGERAYWQRRNRAARVQKQRQDRLGLGWANHDHHTFRSSRRHFLDLMRVMTKLGFERRERYYAGAPAGWGAQILEQPVEGIVVFADVDLMPGETEIDFSRRPLPPAPQLGTVGLWVGLHGESFLEAGMHHLEARFDFSLVREQLKVHGITGMAPFSDFEFLKQAFTQGEQWRVRPGRAARLRRAALITDEQYEQFLREGAVGSHLETLQRRGGFKGFNQESVSAILTATDPRRRAARDN